MAIILYRKGTGDSVKVNEFGFEHSLASGEYFLTREEAVAPVEEVPVVVAEIKEKETEAPVVENAEPKKPGRRPRKLNK